MTAVDTTGNVFNLNGQTAAFNVIRGTDASSDLTVSGLVENNGSIPRPATGS